MIDRRLSFEHDGHRFDVTEERREVRGRESCLTWHVSLDGRPALDFDGPYPYRDDDLRARIVEWYGIQRPVAGRGRASGDHP
jgi:hypothetical protein